MPLMSRYLRSGQQISRFPKSSENEKTARGRHHRNDGGGGDSASLPAVRMGRPCPRQGRHHLGQGPYLTAGRPRMLDVAARPGDVDEYPDALVRLALTAETVEFPVPDATEKSMPLVRCEHQDWPYRVPAVANADLATGQARHLDAVAVGVTQGALNPVKT